MARSKKQPEQPQSQNKHISRIQEMCRVQMDPELAAQAQGRLDAAERRVGQLVMVRAAETAEYNRNMKAAKDEINKAAQAIADGEEDVMCDVELDRYENIARIFFDGHLVKTRELTPAERQTGFRFDTAGGGPNTASKAAVAKQPGLKDLPEDAPAAPAQPIIDAAKVARLAGLGWVRDAEGKLAPEGDAKAALDALGEATAAIVLERANAGLDGDLALAWGQDRKALVDQTAALVEQHGQDKVDAMLGAVTRDDLACDVALALLRGELTEDEAKAKPKACDPPAPNDFENVNPDHVPIVPWVDLTDEEREALKAEIGTESEVIVEWAIHLLKGGTQRSQAIESARRHEAQEDEQAGDAAAAGAPASEKQRSKAAQLQQKIEPRVGKRLADCAHDDVVQGTKLQLAKEKALEALKQSRTLTPEQVADIGGDDSVFFADFLAALYAGEDFSEALLDAKIACQKHADNVAAAQERERLEAVQAGETFESAPTDDAPREDIAAAAKAAFDAALPQDDSKPKRAKKSGGAR